jgi:acetyltransferase-like isoleucine patch superfamily enzyme
MMKQATPIERENYLLETTKLLTSEDKAKFAYFGVDAKILPPLRILNPQNIVIGDRVAIREGCHINAFKDLSFIRDYVDARFRDDFNREDYLYDGRITIEHTCQIGRFAFMSCTKSIRVEPFVLMSERVFIGDNNHGFRHPEVPILQQPNDQGDPVVIGSGTWIGVGAAILAGAIIGRNTVVGSNSVVRAGKYPSHAVIASPSAEVIFRRHNDGE